MWLISCAHRPVCYHRCGAGQRTSDKLLPYGTEQTGLGQGYFGTGGDGVQCASRSPDGMSDPAADTELARKDRSRIARSRRDRTYNTDRVCGWPPTLPLRG
jgi:hypothetical protein